jgi:hypothetical protein
MQWRASFVFLVSGRASELSSGNHGDLPQRRPGVQDELLCSFHSLRPTLAPRLSHLVEGPLKELSIAPYAGLIGYVTQMPSSVTANLLDDGVVDTLALVGATVAFTFRFHQHLRPRANSMAEHVGRPFVREVADECQIQQYNCRRARSYLDVGPRRGGRAPPFASLAVPSMMFRDPRFCKGQVLRLKSDCCSRY